jgi:hypothetical protein
MPVPRTKKTVDLGALSWEDYSDEEIRLALQKQGYRVSDPNREIVPVRIHDGQRRALLSKARRTYLFAGSGGGKTTIGPHWLLPRIKKAMGWPLRTRNFLVAAPTTDLLFPAYAELAPWLRRLGDPRYGDGKDGFVRSTKTWHLKGGILIRFRSLDNPGSIEGVHYRAAWVDEGGQIDDKTHSTVLRRLAFHLGDLLVTTTPYVSEGWTLQVVQDFRRKADPEIEVIHFPSVMNPMYPRKEFERLMETEPWWRFAMFYLGLLSKPEGAAWPNFDEDVHVIEEFEPLPGWHVYMGLDFGSAHPTAIVWGAWSPETNRLYIFREHVESGMSVSDVARVILTRRPRLIFADPSAAQIINELRTVHRLPVTTGDDLPSAKIIPGLAKIKINDIKGGVAEVYGRLQQRRLLFLRGRCPKVVAGVERARWAEGTGKEQLVKKDDDEADALRYLAMGLSAFGRTRPLRAPAGDTSVRRDRSRPETAGLLTKQW